MRGLISFVIITVTVVFQLTVVSRIAFPGGSGPDLVLVMVAALALASGPLAGALIGFWGGLAMDVAPPGSHFVGQDALVFCLVGYACGLLADDSSGDGATEQGHSALFEIVVVAAGAICGEALVALLGVMLSDPRVTWPAITKVLPVAVAYDVLLSPFVLYAAAAVWRLAGTPARGARRGVSRARGAWGDGSPQTRGVPGGRPPGLARVPRLRLAEAGRGQGSMAGALGARADRRPVGREPHLKLGRAGARTSLGGTGSLPGFRGGLGAAFATSGSGGPAKVRFGSRRHEGVVGGSLLGGTRPASSALKSSALKSSALKSSALKSSALKSSALRTSRFSSSSMGRSLLGGSVFSHSSSLGLSQRGSASARSSPFGRSAALSRSSLFRGGIPFRNGRHFRPAGSMMRPPGGLAGSTPRFSRGSALGRLSGLLRRPAQQRSPGRGWLRSGPARSTSLGRGTTGGGTMGRRAFGRGRPSRGGIGRGGIGRGGMRRGVMGRGVMGRGGMGRGWTGARTPGLRSRPARLRMSRPKKPRKPKAYRRWRTGGYR